MHSKLEIGLVLVVAKSNFVLFWWILEERIRDIAIITGPWSSELWLIGVRHWPWKFQFVA
jgi:hypothetical protein